MSNGNHISFYENKDLTEQYFAYRTTYPLTLAEEILAYIKYLNPGHPAGEKYDRMLDIGCGSGQATQIFSPYFNSITGVDLSLNQLKVAKKRNPNRHIRFIQMCNNIFPAEDNSVDFVISANAAHWFDLDHLVSECERVLKPRGVAALCTSLATRMQLVGHASATNQLQKDEEFHEMRQQFLEDFRAHPRNQLWANKYKTLYKQVGNGTKRWVENINFDVEWTLQDWRKYWQTKGDYLSFMQQKPRIDPLDIYMEKVKRFLGLEMNKREEEVLLKITWDVPTFVFTKNNE